MKVIRLKSENVMRLVAVDITPEGHVVTVGGPNGAGKSSVLNSIAVALGGLSLAPEEPIRQGEGEAQVQVDLGDYVVTRKFARDKIVNTTDRGAPHPYRSDGVSASKSCFVCHQEENEPIHQNVPERWGETRSTLVVANKDGARYPSPQALLDRLLGELTFDPLTFARDEPRRQGKTLRRLVGVDLSKIDDRRALAFAERAMHKKTYAIKEAQLLKMPKYDGVPTEEVSADEVTAELRRAEEVRVVAEEAERTRDAVQHRLNGAQASRESWEQKAESLLARIVQLQKEHEEAKAQVASFKAHAEAVGVELDARKTQADAARATVPAIADVHARVKEIERTNALVRANRERAAAEGELAALAQEVDARTEAISSCDDERRAALAAARFPVAGLGLDPDGGVTLNDLPFSQASSSEQLRVSVAVGLALNPELRVLLVRNGNMLDEDSLALVAKMAEEADAQVWCEWVTKDPSAVQVMIEEGRVLPQPAHES